MEGVQKIQHSTVRNSFLNNYPFLLRTENERNWSVPFNDRRTKKRRCKSGKSRSLPHFASFPCRYPSKTTETRLASTHWHASRERARDTAPQLTVPTESSQRPATSSPLLLRTCRHLRCSAAPARPEPARACCRPPLRWRTPHRSLLPALRGGWPGGQLMRPWQAAASESLAGGWRCRLN